MYVRERLDTAQWPSLHRVLNPLRHTFFRKTSFHENWYTEVVRIADYKCDLRCWKFKMADPRWRPKFEILQDFFLNMGIDGFSGSLITNLNSDVENSKWRIQEGDQNLKYFWIFFFETWYREVFEVADYEFEVRFEKFKMADPRSAKI